MSVVKYRASRRMKELIDALTVDQLFTLMKGLGLRTTEAPDSDLYDWTRQRIYDELERLRDTTTTGGNP